MERTNHWGNNEEVLTSNGVLSIFFVEIGDFRLIRFVFILKYNEQNGILLNSFEENISLFFKNLPNSVKRFIMENFDYTLVDFIKIKDLDNSSYINDENLNIYTNNSKYSIGQNSKKKLRKIPNNKVFLPKNVGRFFLGQGRSIMVFDVQRRGKNVELLVQPQDLTHIVKNLLRSSDIQISWNSMPPEEAMCQIQGMLKVYRLKNLTKNKLVKIQLKIECTS